MHSTDIFLQPLALDGREIEIESQWLNNDGPGADKNPLIVFLHEGLGSLSQWRDFPQRLCEAAQCRGLLFSRPGYGRSTPRHEDWPPDYLQRQARGLLPTYFDALGLRDERLFLFGHSDGASLALLFGSYFPARTLGLVAAAPHLFVEPITTLGLSAAKAAYEREGSSLKLALARHHDDTDSAFYGWNDAWLRPGFAQDWTIEGELGGLACPVLALQGAADEYGTLAQIEAVGRLYAGATVCALANCGHTPQRDQPEAVIRETLALLARARG